MSQQHKLGKRKISVKGNMIDGELTVTYHSTDIVSVKNGTITLNTGGWRTATTKTRFCQIANQFGLGFSVYQKKGDWFVYTKSGDTIPFLSDAVSFKL